MNSHTAKLRERLRASQVPPDPNRVLVTHLSSMPGDDRDSLPTALSVKLFLRILAYEQS